MSIRFAADDSGVDPAACTPPAVPIAVLLESSYHLLVGRSLVGVGGDVETRARWLYGDAPFGVLAHDDRARLSAGQEDQQDRDRLLSRVQARGFAEGYRGLRVAKSGRRFWIEDVVMWSLVDDQGTRCGQAAAFPGWTDADTVIHRAGAVARRPDGPGPWRTGSAP